MAVITKLYEDINHATRAADEVNRLRMTGVETSILGGESLHGQFDTTSSHQTHGNLLGQGVVDDNAMDRDRAGQADGTATATGAGLGAAVGGGAGLLAGLGMLAIPGIGPLVAAGWLAATAVGAAGGAVAGGALGAVVDLGVREEDMPIYSESFRRGGVGVSVQFPETARMEVEQALNRVTATDLTELRDTFEADGWRANETDAERSARVNKGLTQPGLL